MLLCSIVIVLAFGTYEAHAEDYQLIKDPYKEVGIMLQIKAKSMIQNSSCTGDIDGKVDEVDVYGSPTSPPFPLELETNNIVHESNKAWIVTKAYGKIRVAGGYGGLCLWLTPSQQVALRRLRNDVTPSPPGENDSKP
jgi:hypothetical protein